MKTHLDLELEGGVYIVEKDENGTVMDRQEIDGNVVLQLILSVMQNEVNREEKNNGIKR